MRLASWYVNSSSQCGWNKNFITKIIFHLFINIHMQCIIYIDLLKNIGDSIVFTHQNDLKNCQTRILVRSNITGSITNLVHTLCITWGWCILGWWWPFITTPLRYCPVIFKLIEIKCQNRCWFMIVNLHSTTVESSNWSILFFGITVHQWQIHVWCHNRKLFSWMLR